MATISRSNRNYMFTSVSLRSWEFHTHIQWTIRFCPLAPLHNFPQSPSNWFSSHVSRDHIIHICGLCGATRAMPVVKCLWRQQWIRYWICRGKCAWMHRADSWVNPVSWHHWPASGDPSRLYKMLTMNHSEGLSSKMFASYLEAMLETQLSAFGHRMVIKMCLDLNLLNSVTLREVS